MTIDPIQAAGSRPVAMTEAQRATLELKWNQDNCGLTWQQFLESVQPTFGCDNAVTVKWANMWLCIETDGYCHT